MFLDSLRPITRNGISENDAEMGELLYDLKGVVLDNGGSLALIHHCNKGNDAVGMEALSGHNSIPGAGNTVLTCTTCQGVMAIRTRPAKSDGYSVKPAARDLIW